ncbi:glutamine synthetase catalytic region [Coraliomargarita sp. CAG:312]|nr:glutamine synthetase catalytic region [Coraliomargarita sp. CAG:312]
MNPRKQALSKIAGNKIAVEDSVKPYNIEAEYGADSFGLKTMEAYLSKPIYKRLRETIKLGVPLDQAVADDVAHAMKIWAMSRGATHYTHWFLPLTGSSAEKHDSFLEPTPDGNAIATFSGKNLILGEPDASSFPSGGLRSTFEARGYTAWDPTSPAFINRVGGVATLCIPTMFCSYTGEVLDKKTPLLRSIQVLSTQAKRLVKCFDPNCNDHVNVTLGAEQEYFLVDKNLYMLRPDLMQTGRTLFGAPPQKHQQLEDHYFGSIKPRIISFMHDVDKELWRIGIPAKTRHNEVAPAQFEIAPVFEELNLAIDHNMMVMEILRNTAEKHGLVCLLHEKPFAGINGSGKHNNWSISVGDRNLLNPGTNPHENALFLTTLCAVIKAVDEHSDLLRSATAGAGNDHRLGANEAPPAIISIFLGEQLSDIIEQLEAGEAKSSKNSKVIKIGVDTLPPLPCDATDRNRTSPFAFTGNKFEFRMAGSSQSCASPNIVLNTIVADAFAEIAEQLEALPPEKFHNGLQKILQGIVKKHKRIIFNGDGYKDEWKKEAAKRGLPNLPNTPAALKPFLDPKNIKLFEKYGVFNSKELKSRYEVFMEEYEKKIRIETSLALNMSKTIILPAAIKFLDQLAKTSAEISSVKWGKNAAIDNQGKLVSNLISEISKANAKLEATIAKNDTQKSIVAMAELRKLVDSLEVEVDDVLWPLPKYSELLFVY